MSEKSELNEIALGQGGWFTAKQAEGCGYSSKNHHYHVKRGPWVKEGGAGLYRLKSIPQDEMTFFWQLFLWSRNRNEEPQAIFSHDTALALYELSDVNSTKVHITVPMTFRKTAECPKVLIVHKKNLGPSSIQKFKGVNVTTPIQTLIDIHDEGSLSSELIEQAVKQALSKGLISKNELKGNQSLIRYAL